MLLKGEAKAKITRNLPSSKKPGEGSTTSQGAPLDYQEVKQKPLKMQDDTLQASVTEGGTITDRVLLPPKQSPTLGDEIKVHIADKVADKISIRESSIFSPYKSSEARKVKKKMHAR